MSMLRRKEKERGERESSSSGRNSISFVVLIFVKVFKERGKRTREKLIE